MSPHASVRRLLLLSCLSLALPALAGCECGTAGDPDAGPGDAGSDARLGDAGPDDAGPDDARIPGDGELADGEVPDAPPDGGPPPSCAGVVPGVASSQVDTTLTLAGVRLADGPVTVGLVDVDDMSVTDLGAATTSPDGRSASVDVPMGTPQGLYVVRLTLSDGSTLDCGELRVTDLPPPTVTDVIPATAWNGAAGDGVLSDRTVTIRGTGFLNTPSVVLITRTTPARTFAALTVNFVSSTELTAVVPSETLSMPVGSYDVLVTNPDGLAAFWLVAGAMRGEFRITGTPPPRIDAISPVRSPAAATITLQITGADFVDGAQVQFLRGGALPPIDVGETFVSSSRLDAAVPGGTLTQGTTYPVRVTNPDGQDDVYFAYSATASSAGHIDPFGATPIQLLTPRWRHSTERGFDPFARAYLYVAGGLDGAGAVLGDTEVLEASALGELGPPSRALQYRDLDEPRVINALGTPRAGHTLVRMGRFLYAIGGASTNTHAAAPADSQLRTIERAKILDYAEMPSIRLPRPTAADGLPIGTWYYQVSAIGPWGESLPSREAQLLRQGGTIEVCWSEVPGATGYNVYRSPASDGLAGTARLLAQEVAAPCFTDTGRDESQPAPGRLRARTVAGAGLAAGIWAYRVTAVVAGNETVAGYRAYVTVAAGAEQQVELRWDPVPGATYNVYRVSAPIVARSGDEPTFLLATGLTDRTYLDTGAVTPDPSMSAPDGLRGLPAGSLSLWTTLTTELNVAREGADAVVLTVPSGSDTTPDRTIVYVTGGRSSSAAATAYLRDTEWSVIDSATGDLGPFTHDTTNLLTSPRAFYVLLTNVGQRESDRPPPPDEPPCEELDGDGFDPPACGGMDCDDTDPAIHPGAIEICGDGIDQDCDGIDVGCDCPRDRDMDGVQPIACGGCDCNDDDAAIHCGATDPCGDMIDQDCSGADTLCACPVDADMDGEDVPGCGGCDCNDGNPMIRCGIDEVCELTPMLCDDGIDQNCDGSDCTCIIIFSDRSWSAAPALPDLGSPFRIGGAPLLPGPWDRRIDPGVRGSVATGPVFLIAVAGDARYDAPSNGGGSTTFEVTAISTAPDATNGSLLGWTLQAQSLPAGRSTHGLDALLYFDYLFVYPAVATENRTSGVVTPAASTAARFPLDEAGTAANVLDRFESTAASMVASRSYYSLTRVNGALFLIGGIAGTTPIGSIERTVP